MDETPESLLVGRRALEGIQGLEILEDWTWYPQVQLWVLRCRLRPGIEGNELVPSETDWYVLVESSYPWGSITCSPAKEGGITKTFPHQTYNDLGNPELPWRRGNICLDPGVSALERNAYNSEPYDVHRRLRWRLQRALEWLRAAARDELMLPNEPFERPQFPHGTDQVLTVAYAEDLESYARWQDIPDRSGFLDLSISVNDVIVVRHFRNTGKRVIWTPSWGEIIKKTPISFTGIWIRLNAPPVLPPWQAPITWGKLRSACQIQGVDLDNLTRPLFSALRDRKRHIALVGYPIPELFGGIPTQMQWEALTLPYLTSGAKTAHGFRPKTGQERLDRTTVLKDDASIEWQDTKNWAVHEIATRGKLPAKFTSTSIAIIGAGALGSVVTELLARNGCTQLTVIDGDSVAVGNLVRHTLTMEAIDLRKASAVVQRLNHITPHASHTAIDAFFPPKGKGNQYLLQQCGIVLDCTGSDHVLFSLEQFVWDGSRLFISLSLSLRARRLYCFSAEGNKFPHQAFQDMIKRWIDRDIEEHAGLNLPREGIGCWHPVFPARFDDIMMMAASGVKYIEEIFANKPVKPTLTVFEQLDNGDFNGLKRYTEVIDG